MAGYTGIRKECFQDHTGKVVRIEIQHWKNGKIIKYEDQIPTGSRWRAPKELKVIDQIEKYEKKLKTIDQIGKYQKKLVNLSYRK